MADSYLNIPVPTPTQDPVPSAKIQDHIFAGAKLDEVATSDADTYTDRLGNKRLTITGIANTASLIGKPYATQELAMADISNGTIPNNGIYGLISSNDARSIELWKNNAGTPEFTGKYEVDGSLVEEFIEVSKATDNRTKGVFTINDDSGNLWLVDGNGRAAYKVENTGKKIMYGETELDEVFIKQILNFISSSLVPASGSLYRRATIDPSGRVIEGVRVIDNKWEFEGIPFSNRTMRGRLPNDTLVIGDSLVFNGWAMSGTITIPGTIYAPLLNSLSWICWASMMSNGQIKNSGQSATGGYTTAQVLAEHVPKAIASGATFVTVLCGRNDVRDETNTKFSTTKANFISIFTSLLRAGIIPVVCTMAAQGTAANPLSVAEKIKEAQINDFLQSFADDNGLPFVDFHAATVDPLTGIWRDGYNIDVSHPNSTGAKVMGETYAAAMKEWVSPAKPRTAVSTSNPATSTNLNSDPMFLQSTAGVPNGWATTTAGTSSVASDAQIKGNAWTISGSGSVVPRYVKTISVVPGQKIGFGAMLKGISSESSSLAFYLVEGDGVSPTKYLAGIRGWKKSFDWGYFYYDNIIQEGVTQVSIIANVNAGELSVAQLGVFNLDKEIY